MATQSHLVPNAYAANTADIIVAGRVSSFSDENTFASDERNVAIRATNALKDLVNPFAAYMGFSTVDEGFDCYDIELDSSPVGKNTKPVSFVMDILQGDHGNAASEKPVTKAVFHLRNLLDDVTGRIDAESLANLWLMTLVEAYQRGRIGAYGAEGRDNAKIAQGFMVSNGGRWHKHTQEAAAHFALIALEGGGQSYHVFCDMTAEQISHLKSPHVRYAFAMRNEVESGRLMDACNLLAEEWRFPIPTDNGSGTTSTKIPFKLFNNGQSRTETIRVSPEDFEVIQRALKQSWIAIKSTKPIADSPIIETVATAVPEVDETDGKISTNDAADEQAADEAAQLASK